MHNTSLSFILRFCLFLFITFIILPLFSSQAQNNCDINVGNGDVYSEAGLIEAINSANEAGQNTTICLADNSTYTLTTVNDPFELGNGLPIVTGRVVIQGNGALIQRSQASGTPSFRIFYVRGGDLEINNLTLQNGLITDGDPGGNIGAGGGAIRVAGGTVNVIDSVLRGNVTNLGGGAISITNDGIVNIANSYFENNQSSWGAGAVQISPGILNVINSTFSGNRTINGNGGAIDNISSILNVLNSTFSGNQAGWSGGGIANVDNGRATISFSTITQNTVGEVDGGGVYNSNIISLRNSIVAGNISNGSTTASNIRSSGSLDQSNNLIDVDPLLGPLADNGGSTLTHSLLQGSPAIDRIPIDQCNVTTDQRGDPRPKQAGCDIGAFESEFPAVFTCNEITEIPLVQCEALQVFYNSTGGEEDWNNTTDIWFSTTTPCLTPWYGLSCQGGNVSGIALSGLNLTGFIPPQIVGLSSLTALDLSGNDLVGSIPAELGELSNLIQLNLGENGLTGSIPVELTGLSQLELLWLDANNLSGLIPPEIGNMISLDWVDFDNNALNGTLPAELGKLLNLRHIDLGSNEFTGDIPTEIRNLNNLEFLRLSDNGLTGPIPAELGDLVNLQWLWLDNNQFSGAIPTTFSNLLNLELLTLQNNDFSGEILPLLTGAINLELLDLHNNSFVGEIPIEFGNLTALQTLQLQGNQFEGQIPSSFTSLINLQPIDQTRSLGLNLRYNMLWTTDTALDAFVRGLDSQYDQSQNIPPQPEIQVVLVGDTELISIWEQIPYTDNGGNYELHCGVISGGPYDIVISTTSKIETIIQTIIPAGDYYCVHRTLTPANPNNKNDLVSPFGEEIFVTQCDYFVFSEDTADLIDDINAANDTPEPDTICLELTGLYTLNQIVAEFKGGNGLPNITSNITIEGFNATIQRNPNLPNVLGDSAFRIFHIDGNAAQPGVLTLRDLALTNGYVTADAVVGDGNQGDNGGAIYIDGSGNLILEDSRISGNEATDGGGAIYFDTTSTAVIRNSIIENNAATNGGAIATVGPSSVLPQITIEDSIIRNNRTVIRPMIGQWTGTGGAIWNHWAELTITNSQFINNTAENGGGAIASLMPFAVMDSIVRGNQGRDGGGFLVGGGAVATITNTTINNNTAVNTGGGIDVYDGASIAVSGSIISNNTAQNGSGGGIDATPAQTMVTITKTEITNNQAIEGGGLYALEAMVNISSSTISGNSVSDIQAQQEGGGIHAVQSQLTVTDTTISNNRGQDGGGVVLWDNSTATISNVIISGNAATFSGGGIDVDNSALNLSTSSISGNSVSGGVGGGGIDATGDSVININDSTFDGNTAEQGSGGIRIQSSQLVLFDSVVSGNSGISGGIFLTESQTEITSSQISDNFGLSAGGLDARQNSVVTITDSSFVNNSATNSGGGLEFNQSTGTIINTTISSNQSTSLGGGGIVVWTSSTVNLTHSTVVDNTLTEGAGGGIWVSDPVGVSEPSVANIYGSIIANNTSNDLPNDIFGNIFSQDYNLVETIDGTTFTPAEHDLVGIDPQLDVAQIEEATGLVYYPLLPEIFGERDNSPVLDIIPHTLCQDVVQFDQLGQDRFMGAGCDLGAVESPYVRNDRIETAIDITEYLSEGLGGGEDFTFEVNTDGSEETTYPLECYSGFFTSRNHVRMRTPPDRGGDRLSIDTLGSDFDTILAVYRADNTLVLCNDDASAIQYDKALPIPTLDFRYADKAYITDPNVKTSRGVFTLEPDTEYYIEVASADRKTGSLTVNFRFEEDIAGDLTAGCNPAESNALWFIYEAGEFGTPLQLDTIASTYDTIMTIYRRDAGTSNRLVPVTCNDDISESDKTSLLHPITLEQGYDYFVHIDGRGEVTAEGILDFDILRLLTLKGFTLIDSRANIPVAGHDQLVNQDILLMSELPPYLNIQADALSQDVKSVVFTLTGPVNHFEIQNAQPFALFNDRGGDYFDWSPIPGLYTLTAVAHSEVNGEGMAGVPLTIYFEIVDDRPALGVVDFTLINSITDQPIPGYERIPEGAVIPMSILPNQINIRANVNNTPTGSVGFQFSGQFPYSQIQNAAPYALFNDNNGDYAGWKPKPGSYTLTGTAYELTGRRGTQGGSATLNFTIVSGPNRRADLTALTSTVEFNMDGIEMAFRWTTSENAPWYNIALVDDDNQVLLDTWVESAAICAEDVCTFAPSVSLTNLTNGEYIWWIRTWEENVVTEWQMMGMTVLNVPRPTLPSYFSSSRVSDSVILTWSHDPHTTWYQVGIVDMRTNQVYLEWYALNELTCTAVFCSLELPTNGAAGIYQWYIQPWGPGGSYIDLGLAGWAGGEIIDLSH